MNYYAIRAIFTFEMGRTFRTLVQSIVSPVLSTSLYFIVFGSAIGSRMTDIDGIAYGAFLVPGLIMLSILTESISNASFGIYLPRFTGTIYEILSAPVSSRSSSADRRSCSRTTPAGRGARWAPAFLPGSRSRSIRRRCRLHVPRKREAASRSSAPCRW